MGTFPTGTIDSVQRIVPRKADYRVTATVMVTREAVHQIMELVIVPYPLAPPLDKDRCDSPSPSSTKATPLAPSHQRGSARVKAAAA